MFTAPSITLACVWPIVEPSRSLVFVVVPTDGGNQFALEGPDPANQNAWTRKPLTREQIKTANAFLVTRNPKANAEGFTDGWFRTGDLGVIDDEGYLYIVDRKNDMVVTGGENVYPTEVESHLYRDSAVLEAAVFGVPDPVWVERVVAAVVLRPGVPDTCDTADAILQRLRTRLAAYKCPKAIYFVNTLPKSAVGKVLRKHLRQQYSTAA